MKPCQKKRLSRHHPPEELPEIFSQRNKIKKGKCNIETLIKLNTISSFGQCVRKDIDFKHEDKTENWMKTEFDFRAQVYHKLKNGSFFAKLKYDEVINDDETSKLNRMTSFWGASTLSNSRRLKNQFIVLKADTIGNVHDIKTNSFYFEENIMAN